MDAHGRKGPQESLGALVRETASGLEELLAEHLKLTRLELVADAKAAGRDLGLVGACAVVLLIGYALCMAGLCLFLGRWLGVPGAFLLVGGVHLAGAAIAAFLLLRHTRKVQERLLDQSKEQIERTRGMAERAVRAPVGGESHVHH